MTKQQHVEEPILGLPELAFSIVVLIVVIIVFALVVSTLQQQLQSSNGYFNITSRCAYTAPPYWVNYSASTPLGKIVLDRQIGAQIWDCGVGNHSMCTQGQGACLPFLCNTTAPPPCNQTQIKALQQNRTDYAVID